MTFSVPLDQRLAFVRANTALAAVPFVPELSIFTATEVTPLWQATGEWLGARGLDVPFWSVPWAGGQGLARWVLDHPEAVRGKRVLDFGSGSGLVAIAAVRAGASTVRAVDVDPLAEAACRLNAEANRVAFEAACTDVVGTSLEGIDVLLAGDVWYERAASERFAAWLSNVVASGVRVVTGDPARLYVPRNVHELARYDVPTPLELESAPTRMTRILELMQASNESTTASR
ncbi:SAM-dependent methyltransferase [Labilithrix luteola]|uniref:SAM-dependent methyltransferase n=1 Tax=Labilithrix luteola TaxID=1391654 RepID=A0A0K1Q2S6_9BACT|nr:50S ribosomal protein L11 methyltransferase [Labilithrix luteola]AKV00033.1 SAM-dependent methyltransferase [Labilithrix luteola]